MLQFFNLARGVCHGVEGLQATFSRLAQEDRAEVNKQALTFLKDAQKKWRAAAKQSQESKAKSKLAGTAGNKQRPRGRAPAGKRWDGKKGWVAA